MLAPEAPHPMTTLMSRDDAPLLLYWAAVAAARPRTQAVYLLRRPGWRLLHRTRQVAEAYGYRFREVLRAEGRHRGRYCILWFDRGPTR